MVGSLLSICRLVTCLHLASTERLCSWLENYVRNGDDGNITAKKCMEGFFGFVKRNQIASWLKPVSFNLWCVFVWLLCVYNANSHTHTPTHSPIDLAVPNLVVLPNKQSTHQNGTKKMVTQYSDTVVVASSSNYKQKTENNTNIIWVVLSLSIQCQEPGLKTAHIGIASFSLNICCILYFVSASDLVGVLTIFIHSALHSVFDFIILSSTLSLSLSVRSVSVELIPFCDFNGHETNTRKFIRSVNFSTKSNQMPRKQNTHQEWKFIFHS